ncbi:hypothetical protein ATANTOWER_026784 [Ataeniobius toweri]|uniref:Uncharacterized protein n=1 Tax=Ataeniobius toweri TaxID=208326 RepID=A0ABU7AM38_9TELE|nr:hypothetical protein [Ataeniobius toweri]
MDAVFLGSPLTAPQHRRGGKQVVLNELTPWCTAEDVSISSTTSWEKCTHTLRHHRDEHSTANNRPAANMLGTPGQSSSHAPYKRRPECGAARRCVSQPLY